MAGDWLTTKKAGRDDDQIAKDKAQAVQARKRQRKPNISASTAAKTKKTKGGGTKRSTTTNSNTKKKPRRTFLNDSDDDDDEVLSSDNSMDSFIVPEGKEHDEDEDDDEQELDDEGNDSDDELSEPEFHEDDENDDDDDDDEDEENDEDDDDKNDDNSDGGFLDTLPGNSRRTRTSKPAPHLQRQRQRPPRTATLSNVAAAAVASKKGTKNPFASFVAAASKPTASARSVKPLSSVTKKPPPAAKKSRLVGRKHDNHEDDGEQRDSSVGVVVKSTQKSAFSVKDDDDNDDDDSPILRRKKRPKHVLDSLGGQTTSTSSTTPQSSSTSHHLQDLMDSSDDNNDHPQKKPTKSGSKGLAQRTKNNSTKTPKSKHDKNNNNNNNRNNDNNNDDLKPPGVAIEDSLASLINLMEDDDDDNDNDDEDEQMAVALALSNSLAENNKANNSRDDDDDDKHLVDLLEDTDDDDENDNNSNNGDNDDDDRDEGFANREETSKEAQQAASILATANRLSIQVLQTMRSWMNAGQDENNSNSDNNNNSDNNAPVLGMIVDGALAMTDFQANGGAGAGAGPSDTPQCHDWISQETMQRICPQITLAKYQLIGVNWMALLHSLQVDVADNTSSSHQAKTRKKKTTNVNGVLADEMGLGKTAQTITFLAWLKYQRELKEVVVEEEEGSDAGGSPTAKQVDRSGGVVNLLDDDDDSDDDDVVDLDKEHVKNNNSSSSSTSKTTGTIEKQTGKQYYLPHLVVAPSSVLSNWEREFQRFAPHLKVVKYHGTQAERRALQEELRLHLPKNWVTRQRAGCPPLDVILTPITYFQKEKSDDRAFLRKFQYHYLVVDEAHLLKNAQGLRYTTLNKMDTQNRLLLTGTPVQNSPQELMSLLCFLMPLFSSGNHNNSRRNDYDDDDDDDDDEHGKKQQEDGGQGMLQHFVSLEKEGVQVDDATAYLKLKQLFAPFVLRRRKQDVLQQIMPPKERKVEFVPLDDRARAVYNKILSDHLEAKKVGAKQLDHVFTQLRKAAHHPLLLRTRHASDAERHELAQLFHQYGAFGGDGGGSCNSLTKVREAVDQMNDFDIHLMALDLMEEEDGGQNKSRREALSKYTLMEDDLFSSAKCVRLQTLLPQLVADGHRILIFSIWTSCLDLLSCLMEQLGFKYLRMQGSTPVPERQGLIDQFSNDTSISVFLLSTKACGLGINLTAADTCIMHDIDFNPFNDLQAEDRVHRIGQTKKTTVIKLVAADTVDADIYEMQQRKARMNAAIMDSDWNKEEAKSVKDEVMRTAVDRFLSQSTQLPMAPPPSECLGEDTSNPPCRSSATNEEDAAATASRSNNRNPFDMKKDPAPKESKSIVVANKKQNGKKDTKAAAAAVEGGSLVESLDSDSDTLALSKRPAAKTKEKRGSASPDREDI